jgi:hypothetical protein
MKQGFRNMLLTILFVFLFLSIPRPAHAYIGPGTLTLVLQILAGLLVGGVTVIAMYWSKIKEKFAKKEKEGG